jgi:hypothetical protein
VWRSTAAPASEVGADELSGVAAISDAPSHGIAGGNQGLARGLAAELDVRLRTPVRTIAWGDRVVVNGELEHVQPVAHAFAGWARRSSVSSSTPVPTAGWRRVLGRPRLRG